MGELTVSVKIADRPYRLVINREHEALFKEAAALIEKRMKDYSGSYAYKDKQDLLAMVALEYATNYLQDERELSDHSDLQTKRLAGLDSMLTETLNESS